MPRAGGEGLYRHAAQSLSLPSLREGASKRPEDSTKRTLRRRPVVRTTSTESVPLPQPLLIRQANAARAAARKRGEFGGMSLAQMRLDARSELNELSRELGDVASSSSLGHRPFAEDSAALKQKPTKPQRRTHPTNKHQRRRSALEPVIDLAPREPSNAEWAACEAEARHPRGRQQHKTLVFPIGAGVRLPANGQFGTVHCDSVAGWRRVRLNDRAAGRFVFVSAQVADLEPSEGTIEDARRAAKSNAEARLEQEVDLRHGGYFFVVIRQPHQPLLTRQTRHLSI